MIMVNATVNSIYDNLKTRNVFPLPLADEFFDSLQDRLSTCVENILFAGDNRFTLLINAIPRSGSEPKTFDRTITPAMIYAGCRKQRELIEDNIIERWGHNIKNLKDYSDAWDYLSDPKTEIVPKNSVVSSTVYDKIRDGNYDIFDICKINYLKH